MKIKKDINNNNIANIKEQISILEPLFSNIFLIDTNNKHIIEVTNTGMNDTGVLCKNKCPLCDDACGCVCNESISSNEDRCRFSYNKTKAYLVISKNIDFKYRKYIMVMIMKINKSFSFGAIPDSEAIEKIVNVSSNLVIDPLTNIFNRKYITDNIEYIINKASLNNTPLCMACIDIDNFKHFNDTYGHDFGDKVLIRLAELMTKSIEVFSEAYPVRIGGDEFIIISVGVEKGRFKAVMNKLCQMVSDTELDYNNEKVGIRISIGVSELLSDNLNSYKELYDMADRKLYKAKEDGKGCVR